jgi:integrase/recombinase XerD
MPILISMGEENQTRILSKDQATEIRKLLIEVHDNYADDTHTMYKYFDDERILYPDIQSYIDYARDLSDILWAQDKTYSDESINKKVAMVISRLNHILEWLALQDILSETLERNIQFAISQVKKERRKRSSESKVGKALSYEQINHIRSQCKEEKTSFIIDFLFRTGLRISTMLSLQWPDITPTYSGNFTLTVIGKGGRPRKIALAREIYMELKRLFYRDKSTKHIFINDSGNVYERTTITKRISSAAKKAGYFGVSAHTMRHSIATYLSDETEDLSKVSKFLGHRSIETTAKFYLHSELGEDLLDALPPKTF